MSIEVRNLSFSYRRSEILHDVSFSINNGELVALLGPNGAGKTTLFRCILGFLKDFTGSVFCDGEDVMQMNVRDMACRIAYIPQSTTPVFNHTVFDTVLMGTNSHTKTLSTPGKSHVREAELALDKLGIFELRHRGCQTLSGGESQLVMIARAIAQGARVLIMDEPSSSLDLGNKHSVLSLVRQLSREGYTVLMSIHEPEQALVFADRAMMLCNGRIIADGKADEVITEQLIKDVYGVSVRISNSDSGGKGIMFSSPDRA